MKKINYEILIRIMMAILFFYYPIIGFPAMAFIILFFTSINKNQIPIAGVYCELPKDKYEIINENKLIAALKIRGYSLSLMISIGWILMISVKRFTLIFIILTIILSIFYIFISNLMLEKYYKVKEVSG